MIACPIGTFGQKLNPPIALVPGAVKHQRLRGSARSENHLVLHFVNK